MKKLSFLDVTRPTVTCPDSFTFTSSAEEDEVEITIPPPSVTPPPPSYGPDICSENGKNQFV